MSIMASSQIWRLRDEVRRIAYKIIGKNKISKKSESLKIARDKGINSCDWLDFFPTYQR